MAQAMRARRKLIARVSARGLTFEDEALSALMDASESSASLVDEVIDLVELEQSESSGWPWAPAV